MSLFVGKIIILFFASMVVWTFYNTVIKENNGEN